MFSGLPYILKSQMCLGLFWLVYYLLLGRISNLRPSRGYLLICALVSLTLPLFAIPLLPVSYGIVQQAVTEGNATALLFVADEVVQGEQAFSYGALIWLGWITVSVCLFIRSTISIARLCLLAGRKPDKVVGSVKIHFIAAREAAFSFFGHIFISLPPEDPEFRPVLEHELSHVRLGHSYDSLLVEAMKILFWWNPFVWLWARSLREVHEYQADRYALAQKIDKQGYIDLILKFTTTKKAGFAHEFGYSLTKKRLIMITKRKKDGGTLRTAMAFAITLLLSAAMFSFTSKRASAAPVSVSVETENLPAADISVASTETEVAGISEAQQDRPQATPFFQVETSPKFEGSGEFVVFRNWVQSNLRYPVEAQTKGIQGTVFVSFVIETDGTLSNIEIMQSPNKLLSDEAVRVVSSSPKWTPGMHSGTAIRVIFQMPVLFRLNE